MDDITHNYRVAFTAASMLRTESVKVALVFLETQDWKVTFNTVLEKGILLKNKQKTAERELSEIIGRLQKMPLNIIELLANSDEHLMQSQILHIAICQHYRIIEEFVLEVLREKYLSFDYTLFESDFWAFFNQKASQSDKLANLTELTKSKVKQTMMLMLEQGGLLSPTGSNATRQILSPMLVPRLENMIRTEKPQLLPLFLYADGQIS